MGAGISPPPDPSPPPLHIGPHRTSAPTCTSTNTKRERPGCARNCFRGQVMVVSTRLSDHRVPVASLSGFFSDSVPAWSSRQLSACVPSQQCHSPNSLQNALILKGTVSPGVGVSPSAEKGIAHSPRQPLPNNAAPGPGMAWATNRAALPSRSAASAGAPASVALWSAPHGY